MAAVASLAYGNHLEGSWLGLRRCERCMRQLQTGSSVKHCTFLCRCIIGAFGALSTPLAGVMAEKLFGYKGGQHGGHSPVKSPSGAPAAPNPVHSAALAAQNLNNARSLENGLLVVTVVPTVSLLLSCYLEGASCADACRDCCLVAVEGMQGCCQCEL